MLKTFPISKERQDILKWSCSNIIFLFFYHLGFHVNILFPATYWRLLYLSNVDKQ